MKHLFLTRYNVPVSYGSRGAKWNPLDPDYLAQRQVLFERFCIPSVLRQTCKDFQWLVFFHPDTPRKYTDVLDGIGVVGYARSNAECAELARNLADYDGPTITSRIDNDDAIAATFIGNIQQAARQRLSDAPYVLTFPIGAFTSLSRGRYYPKHYVCNPFLSLVEPKGIERTILPYNHGKVGKSLPVHEIATRAPMWLSVIHETNVLNQRKRWPWIWQTRSNAKLATRFPGFSGAYEQAT